MFEFLIPAAASLLGGSMASSGAQSAANTQAAADREADARQRHIYEEQVARNQPFSQAGLAAQKRYMNLLGLQAPAQAGVGGAPSMRTDAQLRNALMAQYTQPSRTETYGRDDNMTRMVGGGIDEAGLAAAIAAARQGDQNALNNYSASQAAAAPDADFGKYSTAPSLEEYLKSREYETASRMLNQNLEKSASVRGRILSGGTIKGAVQNFQDLTTRGFGNYLANLEGRRNYELNPLGSLMQSGQAAVNNQATAAGTYGTNAGNLMMQGGQSIAAGQLGAGNTWNNALNAVASSYQNQNNFNDWMNRQRQLAYIPSVQDGGYSIGQGSAYGGQRAGL